MKPQPTLRAEITSAIVEVLQPAKVSYPGQKAKRTALAVDAILQLISSRLPEGYKDSYDRFEDGYNQAIKDFKALLEGKE